MDPLLDRDAFGDPDVEVAPFRGAFAGRATFDGCIAFARWPRRQVATLLPADLALATSAAAADASHPVAFVFGTQTNAGVVFGGRTFPLGLTYGEFALAVPFVRHVGGRHLHTFIARMYSTYFPVVWDGNVRFGFSKQSARMWWQGSMFVVTTERDELLFHAAVEAAGTAARPSPRSLPGFQAMRDVFALPIVGRRVDGTTVCSHFGWDFAAAEVRPADAWMSIDAPEVAGDVPERCHALRPGAFAVRGMVWRLSWPGACRV